MPPTATPTSPALCTVLLASLVALAPGCKKEPPPPPPPPPLLECGPARPCADWMRCVADACVPDNGREPKPATVTATWSDEGHARLQGNLEAGARLDVFLSMGCLQPPAATLTTAQLAEGFLLAGGFANTAALSVQVSNPHRTKQAPCQDTPGVAPPPKALPPATAEDKEEWAEHRSRQAAFVARLPAAVVEAARKAGFEPFGALMDNPRAFLEADLDCDGNPDHALLGLPAADALPKALEGEAVPALLERLHLMRNGDDGAKALVLLSSAAGPRVEVHGRTNYLSAAPFKPGCGEKLEERVDLDWAKAHTCLALEYGAYDHHPATTLLFDHRSGKLVELQLGCE